MSDRVEDAAARVVQGTREMVGDLNDCLGGGQRRPCEWIAVMGRRLCVGG